MFIEEIIKVKRGVYALRFSDKQIEVTEAQLVKYHLYKGQEVHADLVDQIEKDYQASICLFKAIDLLSRRNHFVKELRQKLKERDFSDTLIDQTLDHLKNEGYIDELETAKQYVSAKKERDSQSKIKLNLIKRGCPESIISRVLEDTGDELEKALEAARKKDRQLEGLDEDKRMEKLIRHVMGKGYGYRDARKAYEVVKGERGELRCFTR